MRNLDPSLSAALSGPQMTPEKRDRLIAEALTWIGTPYHDHGAVKGAGADCALMPLAVYRAVLSLPAIDPPKYVMQWHLHRGEELYLNYVLALGGKEVRKPERADFVLWQVGRVFSHGAIVLEWPRVIHAVNPFGVVISDASTDGRLMRKERRFFTF